MEFKGINFSSLQNVDLKANVANVQLFGVIGYDFSGDQFAKELIWLSEYGFTQVNININSVGGSILEGFSIINAMNILRLGGTSIATYGLGVMDSMAGIVLAFGDRGKRKATNFSSGVIHEPLIVNEKGEDTTLADMPEGDMKNELIFMREALLTSLVGSTGMDKDKLREIMQEGTRRSAEELKELGLIDEVVEVSNFVETSNLTRLEAMAACTGQYTNTLEMENEKNELAKLQASTAATIAEKEAKITELMNRNSEVEKELKAAKRQSVESYVDALIGEGKFKSENREELVNQAEKDLEGFKTICGALNEAFVDVTKRIGSDEEDADSKEESLAKEYHAADVAGKLAEFKNKVGESKFQKAEDYYTNHIEELTK